MLAREGFSEKLILHLVPERQGSGKSKKGREKNEHP
jgi:hypothetical protein